MGLLSKGDRVTVGVIAARGEGERTREYLRRFVDRLGLSGVRSGALAGAAVVDGDLDGYRRSVERNLVPSMRAGYRLLEVFSRRPDVFHALLATPPGWRMFVRFCQGRASFEETLTRAPVRAGLALLDRLPPARQVRRRVAVG
ncbi:hypothetical protein GCM10010429_29380 [Micromonospora olivasterospora]|uniref:Uncharacterized protein n=1 Tax=Micromonospora olivasterospora TaxID=1880 RepID=A0A562IGK5_MICOL|nr:hypothetical protein JD77_04880 [Micromonospora olivasterospora]